MGGTKFNFTRLIRISIAVLFFTTLFLIGWNFLTRSKKKAEAPIHTVEITTQRMEKKEKIEHFEVKAGRGYFRVRADKHYMGKDNKYHLEGNVEVVFLKKIEGKDVFIYGDEIIYDQKGNHFLLGGKGRVKFKDLLIESSSLEYDSKREVFRSDKGIKFQSLDFSGSAKKIVYSMKEEKINLIDRIYIKIRTHLETPFPIAIKAERFEYRRERKWGMAKGDVRLTHGKNVARADILKFELFPDGEQIKTLVLEGEANASIAEEEKMFSLGKNSFIPPGTKKEIKADEIRIRGFQGLPQIQRLVATGDCEFKFISSEGRHTLIKAVEIRFLFSREGELEEFCAQEKAMIAEVEEGSEPVRVIEGEFMTTTENTDVLDVSGEKDRKPRLLFKNSEIYASEIIVFLDTRDVELKGEVKAALRLQREGERSIGFFSREQPVFVASQKMRYSEQEKRFHFKERIRMWQGSKSLTAEEVVLDEETNKISCSGGVRSIASNEPKEEEEQRIEISAQTMYFDPDENLIVYKEKGSLRIDQTNLQSQSIFVHLKGKKGDMESIVAKERVIISLNDRKGHGEEARYDLDNETVVLLGDPVLIDKDKGEIRGDKLTFYMTDGRIVVENKDRERSVTVIKS